MAELNSLLLRPQKRKAELDSLLASKTSSQMQKVSP
jgi:hypothetical protein